MTETTNSAPSFRADKYVWLRSYLSIDLTELDQCIVEMPVLLQEAGECCAIANEIFDSTKDEFNRLKSELAETLRREPYRDKQRSESMIDSQVPIYPEYKAAQDKLSVARLDASLWGTVVEALRSKSMQIRTAADLLNSGFLTSDAIYKKRRRDIRNAGPKEEVKVSG